MQSPDLQERWEGCSQLLWDMAEAAAGARVQSGQAERRREQPAWMWRGKELQDEKIPSLGLMHTHGAGLRACTSNMNSSSLFFCVLEFLKFPIQLMLALRFFVVAAVVCLLYMLSSDPLKTHSKPGALFYWVLLKCSPMPQ